MWLSDPLRFHWNSYMPFKQSRCLSVRQADGRIVFGLSCLEIPHEVLSLD
jgi:hypothetical protein